MYQLLTRTDISDSVWSTSATELPSCVLTAISQTLSHQQFSTQSSHLYLNMTNHNEQMRAAKVIQCETESTQYTTQTHAVVNNVTGLQCTNER